jgi:activator of 2-hydroxyglutaryl-CoA dehydratase
MVDAIENELMRKVFVHAQPQYTTAIGAAYYALKQYSFENKYVL